ncbi:MAG: hypothetical protein M3R36_03900 [Bacteroidota bacterium]|nr:hypothetical protein [Bacteroidota bacterium]
MQKIIYLLLIFSGFLFYSCNKTKEENLKVTSESELKQKQNLNSAGVKEGEQEFTVQYMQPRKIYKIEKEDLNNDGSKEIIVLSVDKDPEEKYNDYYNFDMLEVFALNIEKKSYVKILSDTVDYSQTYFFEDLASDKRKQILIGTNSGGNDAITSKGMFVYDMESMDKINLLKYFDTGAPEVTDIKKNGSKEILVSDLFYGVMPQMNAIVFVKEIYKLENQNLVSQNSEFSEFYDTKLKQLLENYYSIKRKVEIGMQPVDMSFPLYREAAEIIVNYYAKDDMKSLKKFWDEEKESLKKNIPQDEFLDLSNFILKALPSAKNA